MNELMHVSEQYIALVSHYEQYHDGDNTRIGLQPKLCPAGVVTWGLGHTENDKNGNQIKSLELARELFPEMETMTYEQADKLLTVDTIPEEDKVKKAIRRTLLQHEFDGMCSYFYNIGYSATMVKLMNNRASADLITAWMVQHYITAEGKYMPGLFYRRKSEAHLILTGELVFYNIPPYI
jgi:lysozyme